MPLNRGREFTVEHSQPLPPPDPPQPVSIEVGLPNKPTGKTFQVLVPKTGVPVQFPSVDVPRGFSLSIKARRGNIGTVTLGFNPGDANHTSTVFWELGQGDGIGYFIQNANVLWLDAFNANDGVCGTVEQDDT